MANYFKLIGEMEIPEDRRSEFNKYAMRLLDLCGIRLIKKIKIGRKTVEVASHIMPDDKNMVTFDYSVFEKRKREQSFYNIDTCKLTLNNCGFDEMGIALMLLMTLQESYSEKECYLFWDGEILSVDVRGLVIENMLGIHLSFPHRADQWGMLLFCRNHQDELEVNIDNVIFSFPKSFEKEDWDVFTDVLYTIKGEDVVEKVKRVAYERSQFKESKYTERRNYLYSAYLNLIENGADVESFLARLI